jgi:hypothetical protein
MDEKGESIFFYVGGGFSGDRKNPRFIRPSMFRFHIPESERRE